MKKTNVLQELETAESRLADDIQALSYIQQELENKKYVDVCFVKNSIETLLKSMLFNQTQINNAIQKAQ